MRLSPRQLPGGGTFALFLRTLSQSTASNRTDSFDHYECAKHMQDSADRMRDPEGLMVGDVGVKPRGIKRRMLIIKRNATGMKNANLQARQEKRSSNTAYVLKLNKTRRGILIQLCTIQRVNGSLVESRLLDRPQLR